MTRRLAVLTACLSILWFGCVGEGEAACGGASPTLIAATGNYSDVNDCYSAAVDGDTITVPSGTYTWDSKLVWSNKSITLKGAGIGLTVIDANVGASYPCLIDLTTKSTGNTPLGLTRITGFTFKATVACGNGGGGVGNAMIRIRGTSQNVRFDHNRVEAGALTEGINVQGGVIGVADHNEFTNTSSTANRHPMSCFHTQWGGVGQYGDNSWAVASTLGTSAQWVVESNTFDRGTSSAATWAASDDFYGCRSVYRFNTYIDYYPATHGTETGGRPRGFRHIAVYRNSTTWSKGAWESGIGLRGGTGMVFDNTWNTSDPTNFVALNVLRREDDGSHNTGWYTWGPCGVQGAVVSVTRSGSTVTVTTAAEHYIHGSGSFITMVGANESAYNGTFAATRINSTSFSYTIVGTPSSPATGTITYQSPFDGNTDATGYACLDGVGRGMGQLYAGDGPLSGTATNPVVPANQALEPVYVWNNIAGGVLKGAFATWGADVIVENREFYNQQTAFDGTVGIGRGARASRPVNCTTGTAYWSTDGGGNWNTSTTETYSTTPGEDGGLDKCVATNTWQNDWYVPPTYPHELVTLLDGSGGNGGGGGNGPIEDKMYFFHAPNVRFGSR